MAKLIVLDFNRTISIEHTGGVQRKTTLAQPGYVQSNIRPGIKEFIVKHLALGNRVAIASFIDSEEHGGGNGYLSGEDLIKVYLSEILKNTPFSFDQIPIVAHYPKPGEPMDKTLHIETLKTLCKLKDAVLFDDKNDTIDAALSQSYEAVLVPIHSEDPEFWNKQAALLPATECKVFSSAQTSKEFKINIPPSLDSIRDAMANKVTQLSQEIKWAESSYFSCLFCHVQQKKAQRAALDALLKLYWENLTTNKLDAVIKQYNTSLVYKKSGGQVEARTLIESLRSQLDSCIYDVERCESTKSLLTSSSNE